MTASFRRDAHATCDLRQAVQIARLQANLDSQPLEAVNDKAAAQPVAKAESSANGCFGTGAGL